MNGMGAGGNPQFWQQMMAAQQGGGSGGGMPMPMGGGGGRPYPQGGAVAGMAPRMAAPRMAQAYGAAMQGRPAAAPTGMQRPGPAMGAGAPPETGGQYNAAELDQMRQRLAAMQAGGVPQGGAQPNPSMVGSNRPVLVR